MANGTSSVNGVDDSSLSLQRDMDTDGHEKVLYERGDVFVHTAVPASTYYDNIIRGHARIIEKEDGAYIDWRPADDLPPDMDFEVQSYLSGDFEWGLVTTEQPSNKEKPEAAVNQEDHRYRIHFKVDRLHSIRRSDPKLAWAYVVFILKDGTTQPALHFHSGGITKMIQTLQRFIWLTKTPTNPKLYIVQATDKALEKSIDQLQLFDEQSGDFFSKLFNNAYYGTLSSFSKVTRHVLGGLGQQDGLEEHRPTWEPTTCRNRIEDREHEQFEFINNREPDIGPIIPVARGNPLQPEEWCAFMDDDGRIDDVHRLKERIFRGGIHEDIRKEAWKFLLGYYDFKTTYEEKIKMKELKKKEYLTMKQQWQSMSVRQEKRFTEYLSRKSIVEKDVMRTDRTLEYYKGDDNENVRKLFDILMTYCMYNFDLGYVQGMSDLLSPILMQMGDEIDSFWCFAGLMEMEQGNFELVQNFMKDQLGKLGALLKFIFPRFHHYLEMHDSGNLFFCFRWLLINFRRELSFQDTMILWEVLWSQNLTPHFKLFVCLAILEREKDYMMKNKFGFNEILKHINELSFKIDIQCVLARAESLCLQLQQNDMLPSEIEEIAWFPDKLKRKCRVKHETTENGINHDNLLTSSESTNEDNNSSLTVVFNAPISSPDVNMETDVQREHLQRSVDEVVELNEDTKSVF